MRIHEYQAKELIGRTGISVPQGATATTPDEARMVFERLGAPLAVIKAQVLAGGRGKAGGIKTAATPEEAYAAAEALLGKRLVTGQTGPEGAVVRKVLVEEGQAVEKEYYVGITIDRERARPVVMASSSGGVDVEDAAAAGAGKVAVEYIEPVFGLQPYQARRMAYEIGVDGPDVQAFVDVMLKLHIVFLVSDAEMVEINPLARLEGGELMALDAKAMIDDNGLYRHDDLRRLAELTDTDELEYEARKAGVSYVKLRGRIGCMVNGAGLAMATMDLIKDAGGEPANFLDVGGGAGAEKVKLALELLLADPQVESILINIFGGILRCDELARGIVMAARELKVKAPITVRLEGTNKEEGARILRESGLGITFAASMREAGETAVAMLRSNA